MLESYQGNFGHAPPHCLSNNVTGPRRCFTGNVTHEGACKHDVFKTGGTS